MTLVAVIRRQGLLFSACAWSLVVLSTLFPVPDSQAGLVVSFLLIFFFGVPHGALDSLYARYLHPMQSSWAWAAFGLTYVGLAALVVGLWLVTPFVFLVGFLMVSALHFSGDPVEETPLLFRALYGGAIIVLPLLLHVQQVAELFSFLAGPEAADRIVGALHWMAVPWLFAALLTAAHHARKNSIASLELVSVLALAVLAPPMLAFAMFFCVMHSFRHILRTLQYTEQGSLFHLLKVALPPLLLTLAGAAVAWHFLQDQSFDARMVQLLFVLLAALTVPHMMLVDRLRFFGRVWGRSAKL